MPLSSPQSALRLRREGLYKAHCVRPSGSPPSQPASRSTGSRTRPAESDLGLNQNHFDPVPDPESIPDADPGITSSLHATVLENKALMTHFDMVVVGCGELHLDPGSAKEAERVVTVEVVAQVKTTCPGQFRAAYNHPKPRSAHPPSFS